MADKKNYIVTLSIQTDSDAEALAQTAEIAKAASEIAYLKHGERSLGFFTKDGDFGPPKPHRGQ